jgi:hypothetical protein
MDLVLHDLVVLGRHDTTLSVLNKLLRELLRELRCLGSSSECGWELKRWGDSSRGGRVNTRERREVDIARGVSLLLKTMEKTVITLGLRETRTTEKLLVVGGLLLETPTLTSLVAIGNVAGVNSLTKIVILIGPTKDGIVLGMAPATEKVLAESTFLAVNGLDLGILEVHPEEGEVVGMHAIALLTGTLAIVGAEPAEMSDVAIVERGLPHTLAKSLVRDGIRHFDDFWIDFVKEADA